MCIEDFCKEKILWEGGPLPSAASKRRRRSGCGIAALICAIPGILLLPGQDPTAFFLGIALLLPLLYYIVSPFLAYRSAKHTRYCVSERGIYIQNGEGSSATTVFKAFQEFHTIKMEQNPNGGGTIICEHAMGSEAARLAFRLEYIADYRYVFDLIQKQRDAAELAANPDSRIAVQPAVRLDRVHGEMAAKKSYVKRKDKQPDADEMFFGSSRHSIMRRRDRGAFLDPTIPASSDFLAEMPEESIPELQDELFGKEASRTDAFPDPTVNPLPKLPEDDSDFFQQGGM